MFELRPYEHKSSRLTGYDPFREMENFERAFFGNNLFGGRDMPAPFSTDIQDKGESYLLEADLPGLRKEDIQIDFDDDVLTIKAQRHSQHETKDSKGGYLRCERSYGSYERSFDVSGVDTAGMKAEYTDGVLKLTMPKKTQTVAAAKRLEIK